MPPAAYTCATATAEITNTPASAIARIIVILIVITRLLTKGSIKAYTLLDYDSKMNSLEGR
jgi:hypothetical protein